MGRRDSIPDPAVAAHRRHVWRRLMACYQVVAVAAGLVGLATGNVMVPVVAAGLIALTGLPLLWFVLRMAPRARA